MAVSTKKLRFFKFRFERSDGVVFLNVGAFSAKQARLLACLGLRAINERGKIVNYWKIPRPEEAPKRTFVMHEGKIIKIQKKEEGRKQFFQSFGAKVGRGLLFLLAALGAIFFASAFIQFRGTLDFVFRTILGLLLVFFAVWSIRHIRR